MNALSKEELEYKYIKENKPMWQIAKECNVSVGSVFNYIHSYGISTRPSHQGNLGNHHSEKTKRLISEKTKGKIMSDTSRKKLSQSRKGKLLKPSRYGGHTKMHCNGYVMVYAPHHPYATKSGYVFEHILAYEQAHNCLVDRKEYVVHHINGIKSDNRVENLCLMTKAEHMSLHAFQRHQKRRIGNAQ